MASHQAQLAARRKLRAAARARPGAKLPSAFFLTDPKRTPRPAAIVAHLPAGWGVIFRHFGAKDRFRLGAELARICRRRRLVFLVSADLALARALKADGMHWPEARLGQRRKHFAGVETASAHSWRAVARAKRIGLDAVFVSTVFASRSSSATAPMGALRFSRLAFAAPLPVYALGGVDPDTAARVSANARTHIAGWASVDGIGKTFGR